MPNSEPIYAHTKATPTQHFDPSEINAVLSRNNPLDISISENSSIFGLMRLRHFLLGKIAETPHSKMELKQLETTVVQQLNEDLWEKDGRSEIIDICKREWKSKLIRESAALAVQSFKYKLNQIVPTGVLADLGFSFVQSARNETPSEDFMLDKVAPALQGCGIDKLAVGLAFYMIRSEYQEIVAISEL